MVRLGSAACTFGLETVKGRFTPITFKIMPVLHCQYSWYFGSFYYNRAHLVLTVKFLEL